MGLLKSLNILINLEKNVTFWRIFEPTLNYLVLFYKILECFDQSWKKCFVLAHFLVKVLPKVEERKKLSSQSLLIIINHCWSSLTIVNHLQSLSIIVDHHQLLSIIVIHCQSMLIIVDHHWSSLIIFDHRWSLSMISDQHPSSSIIIFKHYKYLPIIVTFRLSFLIIINHHG